MKIKYDVSKSDAEKAVSSGDFEAPKPGVYSAKVKDIKDDHPKNKQTGKPDTKRHMLVIQYQIDDKKAGKANGAWVWDRIVDYTDPDGSSIWKFDQFLQAFSLATKKKRKGSFDTDDIIGERCKVRIKGSTYNGEYSAEIGAVLPIGDEDDEDDEGLEEDDDELEDEDDDELEDEDDDLEEGDDDELDDEDEDLEEEEEDGEYLTRDDLKAMDKEDLVATAEQFDVSIKGKKKSAIIEEILEAQAAPEEGSYDDWSMEQLKAELKERELKVSGNRAALIKRLEEDDEEEPF